MGAQSELAKLEVKRLIDLMKDPRYWHADDPAILRDVRDGFKQLHGGPWAASDEAERHAPGRRPDPAAG